MVLARQLPNGPTLDVWPFPGARVRAWAEPSIVAYPAGAHAGLEVAWIERGAARYRIAGRDTVATAGAAIVVPPGVEHATQLLGDTCAGSVHLDRGFVAELDDALGGRGTIEASLAPRPQRLHALGRLLLEEASATEPGRTIAAESLAEALAIEVLRGAERRAAPSSRDARIRTAIELIEVRYREPLTIEEMASAAAMSRFHFTRRFRESTGSSPYQYLILVRVSRAAELLRSGRASVTEAALEVGFNDLGRFAAAFKKAFGCPPSSFATAA